VAQEIEAHIDAHAPPLPPPPPSAAAAAAAAAGSAAAAAAAAGSAAAAAGAAGGRLLITESEQRGALVLQCLREGNLGGARALAAHGEEVRRAMPPVAIGALNTAASGRASAEARATSGGLAH